MTKDEKIILAKLAKWQELTLDEGRFTKQFAETFDNNDQAYNRLLRLKCLKDKIGTEILNMLAFKLL